MKQNINFMDSQTRWYSFNAIRDFKNELSRLTDSQLSDYPNFGETQKTNAELNTAQFNIPD